MKLLSFEFKKLLVSKKMILLIFVIFSTISFLFLRNVTLQTYVDNEKQNQLQSHLQNVFSAINSHQNKLKIAPDNKNEQKLLEISLAMKDTLYEQEAAQYADDWKNELLHENHFLHLVSDYLQNDGVYPLQNREIETKLLINEKLLQENIPPEHAVYSLAMPNFFKQVVDLFANLGALILLIILIGDLFTSEFENSSINILFTQPLKKREVIASKATVAVLLYVASIGLFLLLTYVITKLFGEKGTFQYPVLIELNHQFTFITISQYIMNSLILITAMVVFTISLYCLLSIKVRNTLASLFSIITIYLFGYFLFNQITIDKFQLYNPFLNLFPKQLIVEQNVALWYERIPILLVLAAILLLFSLKKMNSMKLD